MQTSARACTNARPHAGIIRAYTRTHTHSQRHTYLHILEVRQHSAQVGGAEGVQAYGAGKQLFLQGVRQVGM